MCVVTTTELGSRFATNEIDLSPQPSVAKDADHSEVVVRMLLMRRLLLSVALIGVFFFFLVILFLLCGTWCPL